MAKVPKAHTGEKAASSTNGSGKIGYPIQKTKTRPL
jgi:hypothetical protein